MVEKYIFIEREEPFDEHELLNLNFSLALTVPRDPAGR